MHISETSVEKHLQGKTIYEFEAIAKAAFHYLFQTRTFRPPEASSSDWSTSSPIIPFVPPPSMVRRFTPAPLGGFTYPQRARQSRASRRSPLSAALRSNSSR